MVRPKASNAMCNLENHQDTKDIKGTMQFLFVSFVFLCVFVVSFSGQL